MAPRVILLPSPLSHKDVKLLLSTVKVELFHWKNPPATSERIHIRDTVHRHFLMGTIVAERLSDSKAALKKCSLYSP